MPHTPPASPNAERKTEEAKNLYSSQDSSFDESSFEESSFEESSFEESDEENSELSEDEGNEQTSEESSQPTTEPTEESPAPQNHAERRNANTLFGFAPRAPQVFVCQHGHLHLIDAIDENTLIFMTLNGSPELMRMIALATLLTALDLDEEKNLEEQVGSQTEQKPEEGPIKASEEQSQKEEESSEEENNESWGYNYFSM
ncbi:MULTISPECIES: hypothetical protein [unclassified Legionella]|uniref:hypothetical protein n=1 Tax=Legionella sp. PC997 TaxID=2755562 RepID=UPI0015F9C3A6|nr:hypothetical protein [Legionella sp. PC997]QMT59863.1 hypothetical protein HBNCFIEN_01232 [Legionella sp. PC997]